MANEYLKLKTKRDEAFHLFLLMYQYLNVADNQQMQIAAPRIKNEFGKFEQWLRGNGFYLED